MDKQAKLMEGQVNVNKENTKKIEEPKKIAYIGLFGLMILQKYFSSS